MHAAKAAGTGRILLPRNVLGKTLAVLKGYGDRHLESHALWAGRELGDSFDICSVWFPKQSRSSCSYMVSEAEEFRINKRLNAEGLVAMCQIHTHPAAAYHSGIDNEGSALSLPGSLSVVVPNYGRVYGDGLSECKVYICDGQYWFAMADSEVRQTFQVT